MSRIHQLLPEMPLQANITPNKENNQSIKTDLELTLMLQLAEKDTDTVISMTACHMFKRLSRYTEATEKTQIEQLQYSGWKVH